MAQEVPVEGRFKSSRHDESTAPRDEPVGAWVVSCHPVGGPGSYQRERSATGVGGFWAALLDAHLSSC